MRTRKSSVIVRDCQACPSAERRHPLNFSALYPNFQAASANFGSPPERRWAPAILSGPAAIPYRCPDILAADLRKSAWKVSCREHAHRRTYLECRFVGPYRKPMPENRESSWHLRMPDANPVDPHLRISITPPAKHTSKRDVETKVSSDYRVSHMTLFRAWCKPRGN